MKSVKEALISMPPTPDLPSFKDIAVGTVFFFADETISKIARMKISHQAPSRIGEGSISIGYVDLEGPSQGRVKFPADHIKVVVA